MFRVLVESTSRFECLFFVFVFVVVMPICLASPQDSKSPDAPPTPPPMKPSSIDATDTLDVGELGEDSDTPVVLASSCMLRLSVFFPLRVVSNAQLVLLVLWFSS